MGNETDLHAHLVELETKVAFQEQTIETLNTVVTRLQSVVDQLTHEISALKMQLRTVAPSLVGAGTDEKPPHY